MQYSRTDWNYRCEAKASKFICSLDQQFSSESLWIFQLFIDYFFFSVSSKTFEFGFFSNLHAFKDQLNFVQFDGLFFDSRFKYLCASAVFPEIFKYTPVHRSPETFILGPQEKTLSKHIKPSRHKKKRTVAEVYISHQKSQTFPLLSFNSLFTLTNLENPGMHKIKLNQQQKRQRQQEQQQR